MIAAVSNIDWSATIAFCVGIGCAAWLGWMAHEEYERQQRLRWLRRHRRTNVIDLTGVRQRRFDRAWDGER